MNTNTNANTNTKLKYSLAVGQVFNQDPDWFADSIQSFAKISCYYCYY